MGQYSCGRPRYICSVEESLGTGFGRRRGPRRSCGRLLQKPRAGFGLRACIRKPMGVVRLFANCACRVWPAGFRENRRCGAHHGGAVSNLAGRRRGDGQSIFRRACAAPATDARFPFLRGYGTRASARESGERD